MGLYYDLLAHQLTVNVPRYARRVSMDPLKELGHVLTRPISRRGCIPSSARALFQSYCACAQTSRCRDRGFKRYTRGFGRTFNRLKRTGSGAPYPGGLICRFSVSPVAIHLGE